MTVAQKTDSWGESIPPQELVNCIINELTWTTNNQFGIMTTVKMYTGLDLTYPLSKSVIEDNSTKKAKSGCIVIVS